MKKIYSAASVFLLLALAGTLRAQEAQALVEGFLRDVAAPAHGLGSEDCRFVLTDNYPTHHSGLTHLYVNQTYQGIKIHNAITSVAVQDGKIVHWANRFLSGVAARATAVAPGLSPEEAVFYAAAHLGVKPSGEMALQDAGDPKSPRYTFVGSGISRENITVELCYQPVGDSLVLAWNVNIDDVRNPDWWNIRVDARTGAFLEKDNWTVRCHFDGPEHAHDCRAHLSEEDFWVKKENGIFSDIPEDAPMAGSYRVFAPPLESPNHGSRTLVSNPDDALASPYGWHDTNGANGAEYTITRGNNVWASEDADNNNVPGYSPNGGATLTFDHALNLAQAPSTYQDPAITNLFFWNNFVHDVLYHYGFDEPGGNFQANNYGRGGTANDAVVADAQDGSGTNNANFSTPPDGQSGRMQMFVWTNTNPNRDSDLDNGVIAHEYGHGVSTRLTGGPANSSCLNNEEQMGEGWSDWLALVLTIEPNDAGPNVRGIGTYLMGQPVTGVGIRNYPYSTNLAVNPVTYDNIKTFSVPHGVGSVWCSMLWDMTWALIDRYGFDPDMYNGNGGNNVAIRLVLDAMKLQPCNPGFVDGRDAILQADMLNYGGANRCLIWEAFANRGLGFSAVQGSTNSRADGTQAFDLPTFCTTPVTAPTAQFSVNSQINCFGDFSFTDQSANIPTAWLWNFGDGNTSTTINPTHSYAAPGTYTVVLTVTNQFGTDTATASVTYTSVTPPNLSIAGNLSLCPGVSSQLDANDGVGNNTPWTYTWNNGGNTRIVTVVNPGTYTVSINDGAGCTATAGATLTNLPAPLAEIVSTRPGGACSLPVNLESSGSCGNSYTVTTFANNFATCLANAGPTGDDVAGGPYNIGFNFKFYGQTFTQFSIATNGVIQLGGGAISTFWEDSPFPNNTFTSAIALAWDDWVATSGDITYGTTGTAPNRRLIVCFNNMTHATEASTLTSGRIILYESTNVVELHLTCNSSSATQGFQLNSGTGVTIRSGALVSTDARRITPNPCNTYAWSNGATVSGITASISGTYALTVTDVSGCTATASVPVSVPTATIAPVPLVANCANFSTTLMANNTDCNDFVGYNTATTISNNFVACGANAGPSGDDAASGPHPIGFTFMYYG